MTDRPESGPLELSFRRRPGVYVADAPGYSAEGRAHRYCVDQTDHRRRHRAWMLRVFTLTTVAGVVIADRLRDTSENHDSRALAYAIARTYENLGEDYRSADHRHMTRITAAVINAYADDQALWQARHPHIQLSVPEKV